MDNQRLFSPKSIRGASPRSTGSLFLVKRGGWWRHTFALFVLLSDHNSTFRMSGTSLIALVMKFFMSS